MRLTLPALRPSRNFHASAFGRLTLPDYPFLRVWWPRFSIELKAFPVDGRLVVLPPDTDDNNGRNGK